VARTRVLGSDRFSHRNPEQQKERTMTPKQIILAVQNLKRLYRAGLINDEVYQSKLNLYRTALSKAIYQEIIW